MTNIIDVIRKAMDSHELETGKKPTTLYLGALQWDNLMVLAADNCRYSHGIKNIPTPEFEGCKVYKVNVNDHICVV